LSWGLLDLLLGCLGGLLLLSWLGGLLLGGLGGLLLSWLGGCDWDDLDESGEWVNNGLEGCGGGCLWNLGCDWDEGYTAESINDWLEGSGGLWLLGLGLGLGLGLCLVLVLLGGLGCCLLLGWCCDWDNLDTAEGINNGLEGGGGLWLLGLCLVLLGGLGCLLLGDWDDLDTAEGINNGLEGGCGWLLDWDNGEETSEWVNDGLGSEGGGGWESQ
jgi:hypothetical protein